MEGLQMLLGVLMFLMLIIGVIALVLYIIHAIALQRLAYNRGMDNTWLAWVPVGRTYLLGAVGDHMEERKNGTNFYFRFIMLGCSLAAMLFAGFGQFVPLITSLPLLIEGGSYTDPAMLNGLFVSSGLGLIGSLASLALSVLTYIMLYRIYKCYRPESATVWTVLGIFFGFLQPFFLFTIRNAPPVGEIGYYPPFDPWQQPPAYDPYAPPYQQDNPDQ